MNIVYWPSLLFFFIADKRLENHNITTVRVRDMNACELRCYNEPNCVSINFNYTASAKGTRRCDLNNATHRGHDKDLVHTEGYFYRGADVSSSSSSPSLFFPLVTFQAFVLFPTEVVKTTILEQYSPSHKIDGGLII